MRLHGILCYIHHSPQFNKRINQTAGVGNLTSRRRSNYIELFARVVAESFRVKFRLAVVEMLVALLCCPAVASQGSAGDAAANPLLSPGMPRLVHGLKVYRVGRDVQAPRFLSSEPLEMPSGDRSSGKVTVAVVIDQKGHPRFPMIVKPLSTINDAATLHLIRSLRFAPGTRAGRLVCVEIDITVLFTPGGD
jgi:hypothetical protein